MLGSENSSLTYSRCNPPQSTDCVFYQGVAKTCNSDSTFIICKGSNMSSVQSDIFDRICTLIGDTTVTEVTIPECLKAAWNQNDYTILNLFNLALSNQCDLQTQVADLGTTLDSLNPLVNVELCCCATCDATTPPYQLRLSEALQKIVECVCAARSEATTALTAADNALSTANAAKDDLIALTRQFCLLSQSNTNLQQRVLNIEKKLNVAAISDCGLGGCVIVTPIDPINCP